MTTVVTRPWLLLGGTSWLMLPWPGDRATGRVVLRLSGVAGSAGAVASAGCLPKNGCSAKKRSKMDCILLKLPYSVAKFFLTEFANSTNSYLSVARYCCKVWTSSCRDLSSSSMVSDVSVERAIAEGFIESGELSYLLRSDREGWGGIVRLPST